ncbi:DUF1616 domain-containing protein [Halomicroarcula sp. F13]|uniref:DUF1616 domain-containing protein n=1 Tax=Haloarcula rubra TaxID=2487747 RepID=A0AAW4PUM1_9EURY|nr:DUF1616 domain-containing protein [Halomicroarcula rubra]MBX0324316.1 DUF1616 domain-containing protein [Halomicroarcula rubra]
MSPLDRWYVDLSLVAFATGLAVLTVAFGVTGVLRTAVVVPLVTVLPGYAFVSFLYPAAGNSAVRTFDENQRGLRNPLPTKEGIDALERFVFAVVTTLFIVPLVAVVANFTPWGITLYPLLFGTTGLTLLLTVGGLIRRYRLPAERRYTPQISEFLSNVTYSDASNAFGTADSRRRLFNVALGVSLLLLVSSVGYAAVNPPQQDGFTEFYVNTDNVTGDTQSMYPAQFVAGETRTLSVNVTNQEHEQMQYEAVVHVQRTNGTGADAQVVESNRVAAQSVTVDHAETRTVNFEVSPSMRGSDQRMVVYLYRGQAPDDPTMESAYQSLRLPITVA